METLSEYMLRRFCSAYPSVPITLSKVNWLILTRLMIGES